MGKPVNVLANSGFFCFFILSVLLFSGCDAPIETYEPKNRNEEAILSVLMLYQAARNRLNLTRYLSCCTPMGNSPKYFSLVRENGRWWITRMQWGQN